MPQSILRALNYNEKKVGKGYAEFIYAGNFLKDAGQLSFYDKLHYFQKLMALNERSKINTLHISLNFDLSEKLPKEKLTAIASAYMEKIGFGKQPYLVYQHHDAGHPHIHIVTTNIKNDGSRIPVHNIGRNQSAKARVEIENEFSLVKATGRNRHHRLGIEPVSTQKVQYGKSETKRGITSVLDAVLHSYTYTSLAELNTILKLYNIKADQGDKDGLIYKNKGLTYRILDEKGNMVGVPVKASFIYSKPTLAHLEKKFLENKMGKQPHEKRIKNAIDWVLAKRPQGLDAFTVAVEKERIHTVVRRSEQGYIYGLTFIDHQTKCVFNGSDLGKAYSAKAILEKCGQQQAPSNTIRLEKISVIKPETLSDTVTPLLHTKNSLFKVIEDVVNPQEQPNSLPSQLKGKKRKKKRRISHN